MQVLLGPTAVHAPAVVETVPLPPTLMVSVPGVPPAVKVAETLFALVIDSEHVDAVPAHEPPQPANFAPVAGFAVSVTVDPWATCALHVAEPLPQVIAPPVTCPGPVTDTVSCTLLVPPVNVAVTVYRCREGHGAGGRGPCASSRRPSLRTSRRWTVRR